MNSVTRFILLLALAVPLAGSAQTAPSENSAAPPPSGTATPGLNAAGAAPTLTAASPQYVLRPGDVVQVKVYQEEDLTALSRVGKDGTFTMPLIGSVKVGSNTLAAATL